MKITDENLTYIETTLLFYGVKEKSLKEDMIDHICTYIENYEGTDFETAYQEAVSKLGGYGSLQIIQREINEKKLIKSFLMRKKMFYMLSTFNLMLLSLGLLFKINQWPCAHYLLAISCALLIFVTLPFYFYERYKRKSQKLILENN